MKPFNFFFVVVALSSCQSAETVGRTSTMSPGPETMESIFARTPCDDLSIDQAAYRERQAIFSELPTGGNPGTDEAWEKRIETNEKLISFGTRYDRLMAKAIAQCPASTLPSRNDVMSGGDGVQGGSRAQRRAANLSWLGRQKGILATLEDLREDEQDFKRFEQRRKTDDVGDVLMGVIVGAGAIATAYNSSQASAPRSTSPGGQKNQCLHSDVTCTPGASNYAWCMSMPRCNP